LSLSLSPTLLLPPIQQDAPALVPCPHSPIPRRRCRIFLCSSFRRPEPRGGARGLGRGSRAPCRCGGVHRWREHRQPEISKDLSLRMDKSCRQCLEVSTMAHGPDHMRRHWGLPHTCLAPASTNHGYHGWLLDMKSCELLSIHIFLKEVQGVARQYLADNKWIKELFQILISFELPADAFIVLELSNPDMLLGCK
ncbi:unnamed protein product, partial [Urochloa humidicola]